MNHLHTLLYFLATSLVFSVSSISAQNSGQHQIEGTIVEEKTGLPVPYAHVINTATNKGTISNAEGYFQLELTSWQDTAIISFIGFKKFFLTFNAQKKEYLIRLKEDILELDEITLVAKDNSYLYNLVATAKRKASSATETSKAYYELKSFVDDKQVELVEGFYNMDVTGYELTALHLKAGRLALKPFGNQFFASMESSEAIALQKMFLENEFFPVNPLNLSKGKMKKTFALDLEKKFVNDNADSIYVINYQPIKASKTIFSGTIWINKDKSAILKMTYTCENTNRHPFLPLFNSDKIGGVDLNITKTFEEVNGHFVFSQIDFTYGINYISSENRGNNHKYKVLTKAILYGYDYKERFFIPKFEFAENLSDYRKIDALPFNEFFWKYNNEYRVKDKQNSNEAFFTDDEAITNQTLGKKNKYMQSGFFESTYLKWNKNRVVFGKRSANATDRKTNNAGVTVGQYNLSVKIFMDVNIYGDSSDIITETILDPFESYYNAPLNNISYCFINTYFDLCEIERRKFAEKIKSYSKNIDGLNKQYDLLLDNLSSMKYQYEMSVDRGKNEVKMNYWNTMIENNLGFNNIDIYKPFEFKEE